MTLGMDQYAPSGGNGSGAFSQQRFGLSMRFAVTFESPDGLVQPLGEWSACKGLKVEFKTETVKQGGEYGFEFKLPVQVTYGPVTLERAMQADTSYQVQAWLASLVNTWMHAPDIGPKNPPRGSVTIELHDVRHQTVASWHLRHAFPVSWSGPALDANGSNVAIETLTLEHQGFLPPESPAASGGALV